MEDWSSCLTSDVATTSMIRDLMRKYGGNRYEVGRYYSESSAHVASGSFITALAAFYRSLLSFTRRL